MNSHTCKSPETIRRLSLSVTGGIVIYFFVFVFRHTVNVPYFDDFKIISIIRRVLEDPAGRFWELFQNFNGHRFAFPFSIMTLGSLVEGNYNLNTMVLLGAIMYLGAFILICKCLRDAGFSWTAMIPIALMMFQPSIHRNIFWPISTLQYMTSILLTIGVFYCLIQEGRRYFCLALLLAILHPLTNGNGIYIIAIAVFQLIYLRSYRKALIWFLLVVFYAWVFYLGMPTIVGLNGYGAQAALPRKPLDLLSCFFSFMGSTSFVFRFKNWDTVLLGAIIFMIISGASINAVITCRKTSKLFSIADRSKLVILLTGISIVLTAAGAAISRGGSSSFLIIDRYEVYSVMSLVIVYCIALFFIRDTSRMKFFLISGSLSLFYSIFMYWYYVPAVEQWQESLQTDVYMLKKNKTVQGKLYPFAQDGYNEFEIALRTGVYKFPNSLFQTFDEHDRRNPDHGATDSTMVFHIVKNKLDAYGGILYYQILLDSISHPVNDAQKKFILLRSTAGKQRYVITPEWNRNKGYISFLKLKASYTSGFVANIYQDNVQPGSYHIGILTLGNDKVDISYAKDIFTMPREGRLTLY